jgi:hypothetical protein
VAVAFAVSSTGVAAAKAHSRAHPPVKPRDVIAHAAGHKIA